MPTIVHVVDDDASFRTAISRLLRSAGYEVALHESAQQLLDRLPDAETPCCILLDVRIPGLSGPALQNRLAEQYRKDKVRYEEDLEAYAAGRKDHHGDDEPPPAKPIAPAAILPAIGIGPSSVECAVMLTPSAPAVMVPLSTLASTCSATWFQPRPKP